MIGSAAEADTERTGWGLLPARSFAFRDQFALVPSARNTLEETCLVRSPGYRRNPSLNGSCP